MTINNISNNKEPKKELKSRYPSIDLKEAVEITKKARVFGKNVTDAQLAGEGSYTSGPFRQKKASLRYFNLISGRENETQITNLAEKIIYPKANEEPPLKEAFTSPPIYKAIYENVSKLQPINVDMLGNMVIRDYGVNAKHKKKFLSDFISSGIFAKTIEFVDQTKKEIIFLEEKESSLMKPSEIVKTNDDPLGNRYRPAVEIIGHETDSTTNEIPLSTGNAKLIVPKPKELTSGDIRNLHSFIDFLALYTNMEGKPTGSGN